MYHEGLREYLVQPMRPYKELRALMVQNDYDQKMLCNLLGKSQSYITARMTGNMPWGQDDQYKIMDEFGVPYEKMHIIFPNCLKDYVNPKAKKPVVRAFCTRVKRLLP
jgi:hypothetical protein